MSEGFFGQTELLTQAPTVELWEREIERVIDGTREHAVRNDGAQAYVSSLLARTIDPNGETCFRAALDRVVERWQPRAPVRAHFLAHLLGLIAGYAPPAGFDRVLGQLTTTARFDQSVVGDPRWDEYGDLHLKALVTLGRYLSAPPAASERVPAYRAYVRVLTEHLYREEYAGYAARRLYEMGELEFTHDFLDRLLNHSYAVIAPLVNAVLAPVRLHGTEVEERTVRSHISLLYRSCGRMAGPAALHEFRRAVQRLAEFSLERQGDGECVRFRRGDQEMILTVEASDEPAQRALAMRPDWMRSLREVEKDLDEAMRGARAAWAAGGND